MVLVKLIIFPNVPHEYGEIVISAGLEGAYLKIEDSNIGGLNELYLRNR